MHARRPAAWAQCGGMYDCPSDHGALDGRAAADGACLQLFMGACKMAACTVSAGSSSIFTHAGLHSVAYACSISVFVALLLESRVPKDPMPAAPSAFPTT
jgi:hypothetical protein